MPRRRSLITLIALAAVPTGCSVRDPFPELHELTGTVTRSAGPVAGGGLLFTPDPPARSGLIVNAAVGNDGTFTAQTTFPGDRGTVTRPGVPAGRYRVTYQPLTDGSKTGLEVELDQSVTVGPGPNRVAITIPPKPLAGAGTPWGDTSEVRGPEPKGEK